MAVTLDDEQLVAELSQMAETVEIRDLSGRLLGVFVPTSTSGGVRSHDAFLSSYSAEDEGLYDADASR